MTAATATAIARVLIRKHEGLRLSPYRDTRGRLSLGYGHNLDAKPISQLVAEQILCDDVREAVWVALAFAGETVLSNARLAVLTDMAFQLGATGLRRFHRLKAAIKTGDVEAAAREILDSDAARETPARYAELVAIWRADAGPDLATEELIA